MKGGIGRAKGTFFFKSRIVFFASIKYQNMCFEMLRMAYAYYIAFKHGHVKLWTLCGQLRFPSWTAYLTNAEILRNGVGR